MLKKLIPLCLILLCSYHTYAQKQTVEYYVHGTKTPEIFIENKTTLSTDISVEFDITPQNSMAKVGLLLRYNNESEWLYIGCNKATDHLGFASWIAATPTDTLIIAQDISKLYSHHTRHIRVDCLGDVVTLYVDGELVSNNYVKGIPQNAGAVGFRAHESGEAIISNVKYKELLLPAADKSSSTKTVNISSNFMDVSLYKQFPAVKQYFTKYGQSLINAQQTPYHYIKINGDIYSPRVTSTVSATKVDYILSIDPLKIDVKISCTLSENILNIQVTEIIENGDIKLKTLTFPNHNLITISEKTKDATLSIADKVYSDKFINLTYKPVDNTSNFGTIVILNSDKWAATLENNSIYNTRQFLYQTKEYAGEKQTSIWGNEWIYRGHDNSITELPYIKVVIAEENNHDNKIDWQDAIIALQKIYPSPMGKDWIQNSYATITMNFASCAQYPFIRQLDNIKKFYLATDGFGQMLELKGYQSEGHDSGHPDYSSSYNNRAGGKEDLAMLAKESKKYNALIGVHINQSESYPEAKAFDDQIITDMPGWSWLDQSYFINKEKDVLNGGFHQRLSQLKTDIPDLSFIYIDTYREYRWLAYNTAREFNNNGWAVWTEDSDVFDKESCWIHYQPESKSQISRFLHHQFKDGYAEHPALLGGYSRSAEIGFMGWQKGRDFYGVLHNFFTKQLPLRYMMHFPLMKLDSLNAEFSGNVTSSFKDGNHTIKKDANPIMTSEVIFIPWDPITENKIYHYNPNGGKTTWELPNSWSNTDKIYLYELSSTGRTLKEEITVTDNSITLNAEASKGYVIYKAKQSVQPDMIWSEGSPLTDIGFDSNTLKHWIPTDNNKTAHIEQTDYGQSLLKIKGTNAASQTTDKLAAGEKYTASVWVKVSGHATATFKVKIDGEQELSTSTSKSDIINYNDNTDRYKTTFQRLKICFKTPNDIKNATFTLSAASDNDTSYVCYDDVRVVKNNFATKDGYCYFEDFENVDEGWGPFIASQPSAFTSHLSERHSPYTDDTLNGNWSFKTWRENNGEVCRTSPTLIQFKPNTDYIVEFTYKTDTPNTYKAVVLSKTTNQTLTSADLNRSGICTLNFNTYNNDDTYVTIVKNGNEELIIDDFGIKINPKN